MNNEKIHALRIKVIELSIDYTQRIRAGSTIEELKELREQIRALEATINSLEQDT